MAADDAREQVRLHAQDSGHNVSADRASATWARCADCDFEFGEEPDAGMMALERRAARVVDQALTRRFVDLDRPLVLSLALAAVQALKDADLLACPPF